MFTQEGTAKFADPESYNTIRGHKRNNSGWGTLRGRRATNFNVVSYKRKKLFETSHMLYMYTDWMPFCVLLRYSMSFYSISHTDKRNWYLFFSIKNFDYGNVLFHLSFFSLKIRTGLVCYQRGVATSLTYMCKMTFTSDCLFHSTWHTTLTALAHHSHCIQ